MTTAIFSRPASAGEETTTEVPEMVREIGDGELD